MSVCRVWCVKPEVHRCKQTVGYFRGLSIPEVVAS